MANFATGNDLGGTQQNLSTTYKTIVNVYATTGAGILARGKVYDILVGTNGTPADNELEWDVSRMTAEGTATTVTPNALDPADAACGATSKANHTAEGTVTSNSSVLYFAANQRVTVRWVAAPGSELVYPATATNGFVVRAKSAAYASTATARILFQEQ